MSDRYKEGIAVIVATAILAFMTTDLIMDQEPRTSLAFEFVVFFIFWAMYGVLFALIERWIGLDDDASS